MFFFCQSLNSLDLSNFDTTKVNNMFEMFSYCESLISLDLSNFNTSDVTIMGSMFSNCKNLISLNLSSFDLSFVTGIDSMFNGCSSLISLDLSSFNTSNVTSMKDLFSRCSKLEYINLKIAKINLNISKDPLFNANNYNLTICSENEDWNYFFYEYKDVNCINYETNITENRYRCYMNHSIIYNNYFCDICSQDSPINYIYSYNNNSNINCYSYYPLDDNGQNFNSCYISCNKCDINGNESMHNCIECQDSYIYEINIIPNPQSP